MTTCLVPNPSEQEKDGWGDGIREGGFERGDVIKRRKKRKKRSKIALQICCLPYLPWHFFSTVSALPSPTDRVRQMNWAGIRLIIALSLRGCCGLSEGLLPSIRPGLKAHKDGWMSGDRCSLSAAAHWAINWQHVMRAHTPLPTLLTFKATQSRSNLEGSWIPNHFYKTIYCW